MPPRAIWTGAVSFGLVNVPVRMYSAIQEHTLHFHLLHEKDDSRIGYEKVCKKEGKPVPDKEIVKAFEFEKGEFVTMSDEDFETAQAQDGGRTIDIRDFVPYDEVDPILFRRSYYLGPQDGAERVYALLVRAMEESGLAGLGKYVMRDRQNLGLLRVRDRVLTLEQMYFADEIRPIDEIRPKAQRVAKKELDMAEQLIEAYAGPFDPAKYRDTYRDTLCEIIKAKRKGEEIHRPEPEEQEDEAPDLLAALRASVEAAQKGRRGARASASNGRNGGNGGKKLEDLSKDELYELAKEADVSGRSDMSRAQLIKALKAAA
jgi:DNA end-binding protein Ku